MMSMRIAGVLLSTALVLGCAQEAPPDPEPAPPPPAPPAAPAAVSAEETAALADALRGIGVDLECADFATAVGQALAGSQDAIERRRGGAEADTTAPTAEDEAALQAMVAKAKECSGQVDFANLGVDFLPELETASQDSCDCSTWCPSGFDAWWQTAAAAAACLGGSNTGCCEAASWASYSYCTGTECPTNECCCCLGPSMEEEEGEEE